MGFLTGIVEGFYGRQWSWEARRSTAEFLSHSGFNTYLFAPKGDQHLRRQWQHDWPREQRQQLESLARHSHSLGLNWGVGLSPFALYEDYCAANRKLLQRRIEGIDQLGGNLLAILFDDMPGDCEDLAARQGEIIQDVAAWTTADHLLVCPTYYSFDPQLERYFGPRPRNYWSDLGRQMPSEAHLFWTGNQVCSASISSRDIAEITSELGRKPLLWDNYPVNDGRTACNFLNLQPLPSRTRDLRSTTCGHLCNPMNQAVLSRLPLLGLAQLYGATEPAGEACFGKHLSALLRRDQHRFQSEGLSSLDAAEIAGLIEEYAGTGEEGGREVVAWLRGEYRFDPACLTD